MECTYLLDGVDLHSPAEGRYVMVGTELPSWGGPRVRSTTVPGRRGVLAQRSLSCGELDVTVSIMLTGASYAELDMRMNNFLGMLPFERFATLQKVTGGTNRIATCLVKSISEPEHRVGDYCLEFTVVFTIPSGAWTDRSAFTCTADKLTDTNGGNTGYQVDSITITPNGGRVSITDNTTGDVLLWEGLYRTTGNLVILPAEFRAYWPSNANADRYTDDEDVSDGLLLPPHGWTVTPDATGTVGVTVEGAAASAVSFKIWRAYR